MAISSAEIHSKLKEFFGYTGFKGDQEKIITNLLQGNDAFVIMPTGGGKSLCYQLPALLMPGTAIVVSPLIALMKNQVDAIRGFVSGNEGIAHFLNSSLNKAQIAEVAADLKAGVTKLLYVAPESLTKGFSSPTWLTYSPLPLVPPSSSAPPLIVSVAVLLLTVSGLIDTPSPE